MLTGRSIAKRFIKNSFTAGLGAALALSVAACGTNKETAKTRTLKFSRLRQMQPMCLLNLKIIKARVARQSDYKEHGKSI